MLKLVIGDKKFSSWSLRPWLLLKQAGIPFEELPVRLRQADTGEQIRRYSPSGKVPLLMDGATRVWDSLAICEYVAELAADRWLPLWPEDRAARARACSVSAEMHSGFPALRTHMGMDVGARLPGQGRDPEALKDVARVVEIWTGCRQEFGQAANGPFLFGAFSVADAMFAPVAFRFQTYGVELPPVAATYRDALLALPAMQEWAAAAQAEGA